MNKQELRLDRTAFTVMDNFDEAADQAYWLARTPIERLKYMEILRRINYGHRATARLQRVLDITA